MAETLNAGYYLQYLWDMRQRLDKCANFALDPLRQTLSTFHLTTVAPGGATSQVSPSAIDRHILAVYSNLLQRGLPTLAPLRVEQALVAHAQAILPLQASIQNDAYRFTHGTMNQQLEQDWLKMLVDAHFVLDPRLHPADHRADNFNSLAEVGFDSRAEWKFYTQILPESIGPAATLQVELQRPFESLLPEAQHKLFYDQRVDFALELGTLRVVYEVDGPQHKKQKKHDNDRDAALNKIGWRTERVPTCKLDHPETVSRLQNGLPKNDAVLTHLNSRHEKRLWETPHAHAALNLVLGPFAVARIQRTLLWALDAGYLRLDQPCWRVVIVERDVRIGALAVVDFLEHLAAFYRLWQLERECPAIELWLYHSPEFEASHALTADELARFNITVIERKLDEDIQEYVDGDLLIDAAMLQPNGFQRLSTNFKKHHLTTVGVMVELRSSLSANDTRRLATCQPLAYPDHADIAPAMLFFLQNIARKIKFRDGQAPILARSLALKPVIGLLPTGSGKSLCYQLSALLQPGLALVIAPLASLLMDQVENLRENLAIDFADYISSQLPTAEKKQVHRRMAQGKLLMVMVSPERLQGADFREYLSVLTGIQKIPVTYAVIDEAHCVSEWGHDFRTAYLKLVPTIRQSCQFEGYIPSILALTGTASFAVLSDVQREISVEDETAKIYPKSFDRPNLKFAIKKVPSRQKPSALKDIMQQTLAKYGWSTKGNIRSKALAEQGGWITFVPHTDGKYGVVGVQTTIATSSVPLEVQFFSGRQPKQFEGDDYNAHKIKIQQGFKRNEFPILVATKAFGMGIDKSNIRYTIHYNIPQSLESFYQEAGRAGRDKQEAHCWIILSDDNPKEADYALHPDTPLDVVRAIAEKGKDRGDVQRLLFLQQQSFPGIEAELDHVRELLKELLPELAEVKIGHPVSVTLTFDKERREEDPTERAIYRLSLLGLIEDYTVDFRNGQFDITLKKVEEEEHIRSLQAYIQRYKTRDVAESVAADIQFEPQQTVLGKCVSYLLKFVYNEVERKRRVAIQSMVQVARRAAAATSPEAADEVIRRELLAYLEKSVFTEPLEALAQRMEPEEWVALLDITDEISIPVLRSVDGVRQLIGGCRRTLESYPDHPGLLFLSSLARLLLPMPEVAVALDEAQQAFAGLQKANNVDYARSATLLIDAYEYWLEGINDQAIVVGKVASGALALNSSRPLARLLYRHTPQQSRSILLNLALHDAHQLAERLCG